MAEAKSWLILGQDSDDCPIGLEPTHRYDIFNLTVNEALVYGERKYGINLVWGDPDRSDNVYFAREGGDGPLRFGDLIAINIRGGGFLKYAEREYGINLTWAKAPIFEWKIMGGEEGAEVGARAPVELFNTRANDFVIYDVRTYGINLVWKRDEGDMNKGTWLERNAGKIGGAIGGTVGSVLGPAGASLGAVVGGAVGNAAAHR